jgi:hypothetical protein
MGKSRRDDLVVTALVFCVTTLDNDDNPWRMAVAVRVEDVLIVAARTILVVVTSVSPPPVLVFCEGVTECEVVTAPTCTFVVFAAAAAIAAGGTCFFVFEDGAEAKAEAEAVDLTIGVDEEDDVDPGTLVVFVWSACTQVAFLGSSSVRAVFVFLMWVVCCFCFLFGPLGRLVPVLVLRRQRRLVLLLEVRDQ